MPVRLLLVLAIFIGPALAAEDPKPVSPDALWFRLAIGERTILGYLDETRGEGKGYDRYFLRMVERGRRWLSSALVEEPEQEGFDRIFVIRATLGGREHRIEFQGLGESEKQADGSFRSWIDHHFSNDDLLLIFINGTASLYPDRAAAEKGKPIRLCGPFRFAVSTEHRGRRTMLSVGVVDGNDCALWYAVADERERLVAFRLLDRRRVALSGTMEYG